MPLYTLKNPYHGINAHLNSLLQRSGDLEKNRLALWHTFHQTHVQHIVDLLNEMLPPPYFALNEQSLQVHAEDNQLTPTLSIRKPDVSIFGSASGARVEGAVLEAERVALYQAIDIDEATISAAVIRETREDSEVGRVVARIELLSPGNTIGTGYEAYRKGRNETLLSGTPLVEVDYLHQSPPPIPNRPLYPHDPSAFAYHVYVSDPRHGIQEGWANVHKFTVDAVLPRVVIPLANEDELAFDFDAVYQYTHERFPLKRQIDYAQPPIQFETYSPADQARIIAVMERAKAFVE